MPLKNDFVRANRLDLAKAVERWAGLSQLAEVRLCLLRHPDIGLYLGLLVWVLVV